MAQVQRLVRDDRSKDCVVTRIEEGIVEWSVMKDPIAGPQCSGSPWTVGDTETAGPIIAVWAVVGRVDERKLCPRDALLNRAPGS